MNSNSELIEKLAKLTHEEWVSWSKHLITTEKLSKKKLAQWRELWKDYYYLPEKEKEKDRKWARKFAKILNEKDEEVKISMFKNQNSDEITRGVTNKEIRILYNGVEKYVDLKNLLRKLKVDGIIRIQKKDYDFIDLENKLITHFNINTCGHKKGKKYALPKILESGYFKKNGDEKLPLLDFSDCLICECTAVSEKVSYDKLKKSDFKNSLKNIQNVDDLKKEILFRYSKSLPDYSKEELLDFGVSITKLKLLKKMNLKLEEKSYYSKLNKSSFGSTRNGFGLGILDAAKSDKNVVALTADLKPSVKLDEFEKKYPKRFFECGIAEQNMMSMAAGMCINGKVPFLTSFAVFNPGRNWDQLRVSVCYSNHNVKILGSHAGLTTGPDGATHQALEDIAITRVLPNMTVVVPCDEEEARKATIAAAKHKGPVYIRVSREKSLNITSQKSPFTIGKAQVLENGSDVAIIACGLTVQFALEAKEKLMEKGINAAVINLHTIKPLDEKTILEYAKKTGAIVTIEEHQRAGGMGSSVAEYLSQTYPTPMEIIGVNDCFGESGDGYELLKKYGLSTENIIEKVEKVISRK